MLQGRGATAAAGAPNCSSQLLPPPHICGCCPHPAPMSRPCTGQPVDCPATAPTSSSSTSSVRRRFFLRRFFASSAPSTSLPSSLPSPPPPVDGGRSGLGLAEVVASVARRGRCERQQVHLSCGGRQRRTRWNAPSSSSSSASSTMKPSFSNSSCKADTTWGVSNAAAGGNGSGGGGDGAAHDIQQPVHDGSPLQRRRLPDAVDEWPTSAVRAVERPKQPTRLVVTALSARVAV